MTIDFGTFLSNDQKRAIIEARISQFALEGYQHELNKSTATTPEQIAAADEAIAIISEAITKHQTELEALNAG